MSHAHSNHAKPDHADPHNHKHTGDPARLAISDQFFAPLDQEIVNWLKLVPGSRVLDAGCGGGSFTRLLAEAVGPSGEVVALDTNPQLLAWGAAKIKDTELAERVKFQEGDVRNLPFEDDSFELVWCSRVVHGLSDQLAGVRELVRVLKPGGQLVLREGAPPLQFLPFDLGLGVLGLNGRLEVARKTWFGNWRASLPEVVAYPYGWLHMLAEAGLQFVTPKSFVFDFASPLQDYQTEYLRGWLGHTLDEPTHQELLASEDVSTLKELLNPASRHYLFKRDDLHGIVVETIYSGTKPA